MKTTQKNTQSNHIKNLLAHIMMGMLLISSSTACTQKQTSSEHQITGDEKSPSDQTSMPQSAPSKNDDVLRENTTSTNKPTKQPSSSVSIKPKVTPEDIKNTTLSIEEAQIIQQLQIAFANKDIATISKHIEYPLSVGGALADIKSADEFQERYKELLDKQLFLKVALSDLKDWEHVGSRGIMFDAGTIWLTDKIIAINYETAHQLQARNLLKKKLHPSIQTFKENIMLFATPSHIVRVDELSTGENRYSAWKSGKALSEKPDLVLTSSTIQANGSQGGIGYIFNNDNYRYEVGIHYATKTNEQKYSLRVFKHDKSIAQEYGQQLAP